MAPFEVFPSIGLPARELLRSRAGMFRKRIGRCRYVLGVIATATMSELIEVRLSPGLTRERSARASEFATLNVRTGPPDGSTSDILPAAGSADVTHQLVTDLLGDMPTAALPVDMT